MASISWGGRVAEGIETTAQWDYCVALGCAAFQGNYFAAPAASVALRQQICPAASA
ncbi:MAG: EAL domain-containing protein [Rhodoferax sp.]|jgi:EAL domain-containing protein (putative c-di-GMP-specific phosphodiesterase class I)|nr:EAL domain-containing protein [Rhodoferax sp.]